MRVAVGAGVVHVHGGQHLADEAELRVAQALGAAGVERLAEGLGVGRGLVEGAGRGAEGGDGAPHGAGGGLVGDVDLLAREVVVHDGVEVGEHLQQVAGVGAVVLPGERGGALRHGLDVGVGHDGRETGVPGPDHVAQAAVGGDRAVAEEVREGFGREPGDPVERAGGARGGALRGGRRACGRGAVGVPGAVRECAGRGCCRRARARRGAFAVGRGGLGGPARAEDLVMGVRVAAAGPAAGAVRLTGGAASAAAARSASTVPPAVPSSAVATAVASSAARSDRGRICGGWGSVGHLAAPLGVWEVGGGCARDRCPGANVRIAARS